MSQLENALKNQGEESGTEATNLTDFLSVDERFLLDDLRDYTYQSSWDWPADERFAEYLGEDTELIFAANQSQAPSVFRITASGTWKKITQRRLRGLRALVNKGFVDSWWEGTGPGGKDEFGTNRCRVYYIKDEYR